jgi:hypothetical protein
VLLLGFGIGATDAGYPYVHGVGREVAESQAS